MLLPRRREPHPGCSSVVLSLGKVFPLASLANHLPRDGPSEHCKLTRQGKAGPPGVGEGLNSASQAFVYLVTAPQFIIGCPSLRRTYQTTKVMAERPGEDACLNMAYLDCHLPCGGLSTHHRLSITSAIRCHLPKKRSSVRA